MGSRRGSGATEAELIAFELTWRIELPAEYRAFLRNSNGRMPRAAFIAQTATAVRTFYGIGRDEFLLMVEMVSVETGTISGVGDALTVGRDEAGAYVLLFVNGSQRGQVWYLTLEPRDMVRLADDWGSFFSALTPQ
ncbi:MAG TPA: SMI1/KNR4 family protein [Kofleriaceae bacterium]